METVDVDAVETAQVHFRFPPAPHSGKITLELEGISKSYGNDQVLDDISLYVEKGDKLSFVGRNGEGKTTLARIIAGELDHEGHRKLGHKVKIGYYAQDQSDHLDPEATVLEAVEHSADDALRPKARDILGAFLFSGEDVEKKVKVLSGGEKARVALCKLLLEPFNFLVMDEPTNHLDMASKDILKKALKDYDGTLIIVSHDRDFLAGLTTRVCEFRNKKVKEYPGDLEAFLESRKMEDLEALNDQGGTPGQQDKNNNKKSGEAVPKKRNKNLQKTRKVIKQLESKIDKQEKKVSEVEAELQDPDHFNKAMENGDDIFQKHQEEKDKLDRLMKEWEEEQEKLEDITPHDRSL